jgi:hypothetical protein
MRIHPLSTCLTAKSLEKREPAPDTTIHRDSQSRPTIYYSYFTTTLAARARTIRETSAR